MNKDIVCQVPALVGPGKMPMQGSAGAWLPWALPAASAAVELSRQLGAPPPGGGLGSVGAHSSRVWRWGRGPDRRARGLAPLASLPTSPCHVLLPATCRALENSPLHQFMGLLTQQTSPKL